MIRFTAHCPRPIKLLQVLHDPTTNGNQSLICTAVELRLDPGLRNEGTTGVGNLLDERNNRPDQRILRVCDVMGEDGHRRF